MKEFRQFWISIFIFFAVFIGALVVASSEEEPVLGDTILIDTGPVAFSIRSIFFKGQFLGYVNEGVVKSFSRYRAYQPCSAPEPDEYYSTCSDWVLLDTKTGSIKPLGLPQFNFLLTDPAFFWPYIAYVKYNLVDDPNLDTVLHCVIFDYRAQKIIDSQTARLASKYFGTDVSGLFPAPQIDKKGGLIRVQFNAATFEGVMNLCEILLPSSE